MTVTSAEAKSKGEPRLSVSDRRIEAVVLKDGLTIDLRVYLMVAADVPDSTVGNKLLMTISGADLAIVTELIVHEVSQKSAVEFHPVVELSPQSLVGKVILIFDPAGI